MTPMYGPVVRGVVLQGRAIQRLTEGATQADLARTYGVSQATISRLQPSPFEVASVGRRIAPKSLGRHR
jgi:hypothetical protein